MPDITLQIVVDDVTQQRLQACAKWRKVSVERLLRAYVEDWVDVDFPESQGRLTRRGVHRDGPIGLDENFRASRNWTNGLKDRPQ